jgi:hypothetical protein
LFAGWRCEHHILNFLNEINPATDHLLLARNQSLQAPTDAMPE